MGATDTFSDRLMDLLKTWVAILFALYPAVVLTGVGWMIADGLLQGSIEGIERIPASVLFALEFGLVFGLPLALAFSILALPFLMLRRFVVGPRRPWLRPGYLAVALYGPAILVILGPGWSHDDGPMVWLYEAIALIATGIYVQLAATSGPFRRRYDQPIGD
jgi:hypothetical protein